MSDISLTNPRRVNVPDGWSLVPIENLCLAVTSGSTPLRSKSAYYENGSISWFKTGELKDGPLFTSEEKITGAALEQTSVKLYPAGTILMAMYGDGKTITSLGYLQSPAASNQACCAMIVNPDICTREYLFYALKNHREDFIRIATGGAQRNLSTRLIRRFGLALPPVRTQETIGSFLASIDDKIELNRRMNETLEAMAQAIFRDWFVDFGPTRRKLEGATDPLTIMGGLVQDTGRAQALADLFPAALGDDGLPEGWNAGRLDELAEVHMGASPKGDTYNEEGVGTPLANGPVEFGDYFLVEKKWTTSPTRLSQVGDFVICVRGSTTGRHVFADGVYCLGRGVAALRGLPGEQDFVNATIIMHLDTLLQKTTGSVFPNLSGDDIRSFICLVPPKSVRQQFSLLAEPLRMRIWHNVHENRTLSATRDLLLPKLMSGEIRLSEAEGLMEAAQ